MTFLAWAGGKRWFVASHSNLFPHEYDNYIEPFLGSGAVYFHCKPSSAIIGDRNDQLIACYSAIKDDYSKVWKNLRRHHANHSNQYYYQVRSMTPRTRFGAAARFIYLNRTCWNGLYRVNRKGQFNVPKGTKNTVVRDDDDFAATSRLLSGADIRCSDFEGLIDDAKGGDFLFVDPPYTVRHKLNGFIKYNETLFSWEDQERLAAAIGRAKQRGVQVLLTNADHVSVRALYSKSFRVKSVSRYSSISSSNSSRAQFSELLIT